MDLDFGHGFIPRIGEQNCKAVDRCVGPTDLFSSSLGLPWAIAGTLAASTGAGTKELMYRLGHASHQAALRYQHATRQRDRAIADALDDLISPAVRQPDRSS